MDFELTLEERAEIKESLLYLHSQIDRSRALLQVVVVEVVPDVPLPAEEDVERWLTTGRWNQLRKTAKHALVTGLAKAGL